MFAVVSFFAFMIAFTVLTLGMYFGFRAINLI